jgi:hypothetical protein
MILFELLEEIEVQEVDESVCIKPIPVRKPLSYQSVRSPHTESDPVFV